MPAVYDTELPTMYELAASTQLEAVLYIWIKAGFCRRIGDWYKLPDRRGDLWAGEAWGYRFNFESEGQRLVEGSFSFREI